MKNFKFFFFIFLIFIFQFLQGQDWQLIGLNGENISALALDWSNPEVIYAGSSSDFSAGKVGGIFKSTDGGAVWDTLIRGVTVRDLDIDPRDPNVLYATLGLNLLTRPGIIKSLDGGLTWFWADSGILKSPEVGPTKLIIDPKHPDTLYTGTAGIYGGRFYKSIDGGIHWFSLGDTTRLRNGVTAIAVDPENTQIIYAGTAYSGNLLKSIDGGNNWQVTSLPEVGIVRDIKVDPFNSNKIFCGTWHDGLFISNDKGLTWNNSVNGLPSDTIFSVSLINICKNNPKNIYIGVAAWESENGGIYESNDHGENWIKINSPFTSDLTYLLLTYNCKYLFVCGNGIYKKSIPTNINDKKYSINNIPQLYSYPNPFNDFSNITYHITKRGMVELDIYDILGRKKTTLFKEIKDPGEYHIIYYQPNLASGIYIIRLRTEKEVLIRKIIKIR